MDLRIKTFEFTVSNGETKNRTGDMSNYDPMKDEPKTTPFSEMDNVVNEFLSHVAVQDVKVNDFVLEQGGEGKTNTVIRTYTVLYI